MLKIKKFKKSFQIAARIEYGICPYCNMLSPLLFLYKDFYRCSLCGEEVEQFINGVIKYIPIENNKRIGLMTEIDRDNL
jgi:DNA-directed RNA polymerase subunit RPC12/RpoP